MLVDTIAVINRWKEYLEELKNQGDELQDINEGIYSIDIR